MLQAVNKVVRVVTALDLAVLLRMPRHEPGEPLDAPTVSPAANRLPLEAEAANRGFDPVFVKPGAILTESVHPSHWLPTPGGSRADTGPAEAQRPAPGEAADGVMFVGRQP